MCSAASSSPARATVATQGQLLCCLLQIQVAVQPKSGEDIRRSYLSALHLAGLEEESRRASGSLNNVSGTSLPSRLDGRTLPALR